MNIFVLDNCPMECAKAHCDKHVIKMITEYSQIISTVLRDEIKYRNILYKPTHLNHPATKWANKDHNHLYWLNRLLEQLIHEYDYRFGKKDKFIRSREICLITYEYFEDIHNSKMLSLDPLKFELIMPDEFKTESHINSYRNYYKFGKTSLLRYTKREIPGWIK